MTIIKKVLSIIFALTAIVLAFIKENNSVVILEFITASVSLVLFKSTDKIDLFSKRYEKNNY